MARDLSPVQVSEQDGTPTPEFAMELERLIRTEQYTTTQISDASSSCNSTRFESKMIWNTTTNLPFWSAGDARTDDWVSFSTTITPS